MTSVLAQAGQSTTRDQPMNLAKGLKKMILAGASCAALWATPASAIPIAFEYEGVWSSTPTAPFASTYEATFVADNGGSSALGQTYDQSDFLSLTLTSGSFSNTWLPTDTFWPSPNVFAPRWAANFSTDGLGQIVDGWFNASNAGGYVHFDHVFSHVFAVTSGGVFAGFFDPDNSLPGQPVVNAVPLPGTLALIGLGLVGVWFAGGLRRRSYSCKR